MIRTFLALLCLGGVCFGQETKPDAQPPKYYRLDFTVKEIQAGKVTNSRSYSVTIASPGLKVEIRAGEKIPSGQFTFDVGVNIDSRDARMIGDRLGLIVAAEISALADPPEKQSTPIIRQTRMDSAVLVPLRKPTVIFSSDEPFSKGNLQIEMTATPLN